MIPSLTSGAISWVGHVGLGQGPSGAGQMPAWPPSAHCTGWWWGWSPQGDLLPDACYFPSEKVTHFPAAVNGPHHRCSVARHSPMGMPCASPENNAQSTLWEKVPFPGSIWQGLPVGTREGLGQARVWQAEWTLGEDAVCVRRGVCVGMHTCQGKGGMQRTSLDVGSSSVPMQAQHCGDLPAPLARWIQAHSLCRGTQALRFPLMTWLDLWNIKGNKNIDEQIKEKKKGEL